MGGSSTTATTHSPSTIRARRSPTSPEQDTQIARALAARLDYSGNEAFDLISRSSFGTSRSVYSFDGDWGNDVAWGANAPYDYFQRFDRERRTLSEDLRIVSRASVDHGARLSWLAGAYALRTDEDVQQHDIIHDGPFDADVRTRRATTAPPISLPTDELEWRLGDATVLTLGRARRAAQRRLSRYEWRGLFSA